MNASPHITTFRPGVIADKLDVLGTPSNKLFRLHPERPSGGAHMRNIFFSEELGLVRKTFNPDARDIKESLALARERLGGLVAPFDVTTGGGIIYQESTTALNYYLRSLAPEDPKIGELAAEYYGLILRCINRGVFNWDPKPENME